MKKRRYGVVLIVLFMIIFVILFSVFKSNEEEKSVSTKITEKETSENEEKKEILTTESRTEEALPEDYDLPVEKITSFHPDPLHILKLEYEKMPVLKSTNEVGLYIIYNLLSGNMSIEFYLDRSMNVSDEVGYKILEDACTKAETYILFGAYNTYDQYTEDRGDEKGVYAKLEFRYIKPEYDLEAKAEALEFVLKNPVPKDGFKNMEEEKQYAKKIHDYVAKKVTYDPIGYDQEQMNQLFDYDGKQEAYNVLGEDEKTSVCAGYARAFALIAQYAGIDCVWVMGNETDDGGSHAWNILYPCDKSATYTVDVTWDDTNSYDVEGQTDVDTYYFYKLTEEDNEHIVNTEMKEFLEYMEEIKQDITEK